MRRSTLAAFATVVAITWSVCAAAISPQDVAAPTPTVLWIMAWNKDCLSACASIGMAPVMGGQIGSREPKLCPLNDFSLCALQNSSSGGTFLRAGESSAPATSKFIMRAPDNASMQL
jgi:hypothetical protein